MGKTTPLDNASIVIKEAEYMFNKHQSGTKTFRDIYIERRMPNCIGHYIANNQIAPKPTDTRCFFVLAQIPVELEAEYKEFAKKLASYGG